MEKSVFQYKVAPKQVDFTRRLSVSSTFDIILGAAGDDAHSRGFGVDALAQNNYGWVLSRICFELDYCLRSIANLHFIPGLAITIVFRLHVISSWSMPKGESLVVLYRSGVCSIFLRVCQPI